MYKSESTNVHGSKSFPSLHHWWADPKLCYGSSFLGIETCWFLCKMEKNETDLSTQACVCQENEEGSWEPWILRLSGHVAAGMEVCLSSQILCTTVILKQIWVPGAGRFFLLNTELTCQSQFLPRGNPCWRWNEDRMQEDKGWDGGKDPVAQPELGLKWSELLSPFSGANTHPFSWDFYKEVISADIKQIETSSLPILPLKHLIELKIFFACIITGNTLPK